MLHQWSSNWEFEDCWYVFVDTGTGREGVPQQRHSNYGTLVTQRHGKGPERVRKPFRGYWRLAAPSQPCVLQKWALIHHQNSLPVCSRSQIGTEFWLQLISASCRVAEGTASLQRPPKGFPTLWGPFPCPWVPKGPWSLRCCWGTHSWAMEHIAPFSCIGTFLDILVGLW